MYNLYAREEIKQNYIKHSIKTTIGRKKKKNKCNGQETVTNMVCINPTKLIIMLNVNGLKTPIPRQRLPKWI